MKVLLLPSWYPDNNNSLNGIFFKEQAEALQKRGIEVIVLSINILSLNKIKSNNEKMGLTISIENGVKVYRYYTFNYFPKITELYLRYYSSIVKKMVDKIKCDESYIDLVHIHSAIDAGIAYYLSKQKIPYILTEHSTKYERNILNSTQKKYLPNVFKKCSKIIAVGEGLKKSMSKYISKENILVIPNMVAIDKENTFNNNKKDEFIFFSLGLLTKKKGMDILIDAFNNKKNQLGKAKLLIGGDGEEYNNLQNKIKYYGLEDRVILLGKLERNDVNREMKKCNAFVLTSRFETFGIVFLEAMIKGKPVIATKTGGPDSFINKEVGILVEVDNVQQIGEALVEVYNNIDRYDNQFIADYCYTNFSENAIISKIIEIYKNI